MIEKIIEKEGFVVVNYHKTGNYIQLNWKKLYLALEDMKDVHGKIAEMAKLKGVNTLIANTLEIKDCLRPEVLPWWGEVMVPRYFASGIRNIISVIPFTALGRAANNTWKKQVLHGINLFDAGSIGEAMLIAIQNK
jgi:hypothetical protein